MKLMNNAQEISVVTLTLHTLTPDLTLWDIAYSLKEQLNQAMKPETILEIIA